MIVENIGYKNRDAVIELFNDNIKFTIYNTRKGTQILLLNTYHIVNCIFYPKKDRLPWKLIEDKCINQCIEIVFDSEKDSVNELNIEKWNNGNQILCYKEYELNY